MGAGFAWPPARYMPIVNVPWVQHTVDGQVCIRCHRTDIPAIAVLDGSIAYEKQGRYFTTAPAQYELCQEVVA